MATNAESSARFAPFRSMDEFILKTERYQMPTFSDRPKWNNRVVSNLLYFQTNYFVVALTFILLGTFTHAQEVTFGTFAILLAGLVAFIGFTKDQTILQQRKEHPYLLLSAIVVVCYLFISQLANVLVVTFTVLLPMFIVLLHASLRMRDLKNKVNNQVEGNLRHTVMGSILDALDLNVKP